MEEAERSRREGNRNPWIFRAICVCMSSLYLTAIWSVFTWMCSPLLHSFGAKFIPLEGKASSERWGVKQRRGLGGSQEPLGTPAARGRQPLLRPPGWSLSWLDIGEGTCFHCRVGHPWLLRRVWAQTRLRSCVLEKAVPRLPWVPESGPAVQKWTLGLSKPPQWKQCLSPRGRVSRAISRGTSNANLSLPSVVMPFQLFSLLGQPFWGGV